MYNETKESSPSTIQGVRPSWIASESASAQEYLNPIQFVAPEDWPAVCVEVGREDETVLLSWLDELIATKWNHEASLLLMSKVIQCFSLFKNNSKAENFGFELKKMKGPICPSFHVDKIDFRLVCALVGPGPEVLDPQHVKLDHDLMRLEPVKEGQSGRVLPSLQPVLLRGWKAYQRELAQPSVHRSPSLSGWRYLLRMDEIL